MGALGHVEVHGVPLTDLSAYPYLQRLHYTAYGGPAAAAYLHLSLDRVERSDSGEFYSERYDIAAPQPYSEEGSGGTTGSGGSSAGFAGGGGSAGAR